METETTTLVFGSMAERPADAHTTWAYSWARAAEGRPFRMYKEDGWIRLCGPDGVEIATANAGADVWARAAERFGVGGRQISYEARPESPSLLMGTLTKELDYEQAWRFCLAARTAWDEMRP